MKPQSFVTLGLLLLATPSIAAPATPAEKPACPTAREFITALEFLRGYKDLKVGEAEARKIASEVATGCTGAADRFVRVMKPLMKAGLGGGDSTKTALTFAKKSDPETATFLFVFQRAFLPEYLDLDIASSMRMARALSLEFNGDIKNVRADFETLLDFCLSEKKLNLPRPRCGDFASSVTKKGEPWSGGISKPFLRLFDFLRNEGPQLTTEQALQTAEEVASAGPAAPDNFMQSYRYAVSKSGLNLPRQEALNFSKKLSTRGDTALPSEPEGKK